MSDALLKLKDQIAALTPAERDELFDYFDGDVAPTLSPEWREEIRRRLDDFRAGRDDAEPAEAFLERMREKHG